MDNDLKIILYVVIAIVWVIYNNYKKIAAESGKRDPSKPPADVIQENWPKQPEPERKKTPATPLP